MQRSVSLIKSSCVELVFNINLKNKDAVLSVTSGTRTFSTKNVQEAVDYYHKEVTRQHDLALKLLEDKTPKPQQFIVGKHRGRLG
jgi:hypothetical protein